MKIITLLGAAVIVAISGCSPTSSPVQEKTHPSGEQIGLVDKADQNQRFNTFKETFLDQFWFHFPGWGTYVGYYKYDDKLVVPDAASRSSESAFLTATLSSLKAFDIDRLSASNATDLALIKNQIESGLWYLDEFKEFQWNPAQYNVANIFGLIINADYKPLEERLLTISRRLEYVPAYYQAAMQTISRPTKSHTRLAIEQNKGALDVFEKMIPSKLAESTLPEDDAVVLQANLLAAAQSIEEYIDWLEALELNFNPDNFRDFRIGEALYEKKFGFDIVSNYSAYELYQKAIAEKNDLHQRMLRITEQLWPRYFPELNMPGDQLLAIKQMIDHLSAKHIERGNFVKEIRRQMPIIQKFIDDNKLLDSDSSRPLVVREAPKYQRGFAGASVDAPGPYDATANTYYNVTPLDDYTPEQAESYLREYNHWVLQVLNIHEAIPGHYTQLLHANKSPSKIKSVFGNGAMIEGWAVYSERMMLQEGYGDNEPEMWLMWSKWNLRAVVNTILDYKVQVLGMTQDQALDMLINEAFQEQTEADGKWRRATLSQVQLVSYFNGYAEIYAFREELKNLMGDQFKLRDFHNKFLSYGSAPVPVIRRLMLDELGFNARSDSADSIVQ
ncbi:MAG: hypothetical protein ACI9XU_000201 [Arenicella sp.]|jgi:uncharacterized protein (DUF885 family)